MELFSRPFRRVQAKLARRAARAYWRDHPLSDPQRVHSWLHHRIEASMPTAVGRLGRVEASIALWAEHLVLPAAPLPGLATSFADTAAGATNAGIRPRSEDSYRAFSHLAVSSLFSLDVMGVWSGDWEPVFLERMERMPQLVDVEVLSPTFEYRPHWAAALAGKRVLVVSPFIDSFESQLSRWQEIWPDWSGAPFQDFIGYQFPYLVEEDCPSTWWDVYKAVSAVVAAGDYDVALFGCGGLGLPLAALARRSGRVGLHLGGHLQLLFGVYGSRHVEHPWHQRRINAAWVRPGAQEVPKCASRIEQGCYW